MKVLLLIVFITGLAHRQSLAQDVVALNKKHFNHSKTIALKGYDAVAYITQTKAVKGNKNFAVYHEGIHLLFFYRNK